MPYAVDKPSPSPAPMSRVLKNGSKMRAASASVMPAPVSVTVTRAIGPSLLLSMVMAPPAGKACSAFVSRLRKTCSSW